MGISEIFYSLDIEIESSKQEINNYIYDNYVSKDKIRDKIKELKECRMRAISDIGLQIFNAEISMLEQLLEE